MPPSQLIRAIVGAGVLLPLLVLAPAFMARDSLDWLTKLSYLGCALTPMPFGGWLTAHLASDTTARRIMTGGLVLALAVAAWGYWSFHGDAGAASAAAATVLAVPMTQLIVILAATFAGWYFGRHET